MRKRRVYLVLLILALSGVIGLIVAGAFREREREPEYGGKRLSEWIIKKSVPPFYMGRTPPWESPSETDEAIRAIGMNGLPYLLSWMSYKPPRWKTNVLVFLNRFGFVIADGANSRAEAAMWALGILGPKGEASIPELVRMIHQTNAPNGSRRALSALSGLGIESCAASIALITNKCRLAMSHSIQVLSLRARDAEAARAIAGCLKEPNESVAREAARVLAAFQDHPDIVVPALAEALRDSRVLVRRAAMKSMWKFNSEPEAAVAALLGWLQDPDPQMRAFAEEALKSMDPKSYDRSRWGR